MKVYSKVKNQCEMYLSGLEKNYFLYSMIIKGLNIIQGIYCVFWCVFLH